MNVVFKIVETIAGEEIDVIARHEKEHRARNELNALILRHPDRTYRLVKVTKEVLWETPAN